MKQNVKIVIMPVAYIHLDAVNDTMNLLGSAYVAVKDLNIMELSYPIQNDPKSGLV